MKTSLNIEDRLFGLLQRESIRQKKTLGEILSEWARVGYEALGKQGKKGKRRLHGVNLGGEARIDINSRKEWMDLL